MDLVSDSMVPMHVRDLLQTEKMQNEKEEFDRKERMNNLVVRVYYKNNDKCIQVKKTDTMRQLEKVVLEEFDLTGDGINTEDFRIRGYSPNYELMQDTYTGREEQTLQELRFY